MDDDVDSAERDLDKGDSSFHKVNSSWTSVSILSNQLTVSFV